MRPVVRLFVACWNGTPDTPVTAFTLPDLLNAVRPRPGDQYPLSHRELCFYARVTGGRGTRSFAIRQRYGVGPANVLVWQSRSIKVDMGTDPLAIGYVVMRMKGLPFLRPGQYEFLLVCDEVELEPAYYIDARP